MPECEAKPHVCDRQEIRLPSSQEPAGGLAALKRRIGSGSGRPGCWWGWRRVVLLGSSRCRLALELARRELDRCSLDALEEELADLHLRVDQDRLFAEVDDLER